MEKTASEHALSVIKAGISAVPVFGGPIASLIGDYVPTATQRIIEEAIKELKSKFDSLKERLDVESVNKDEFAELFKSCYLVIIRSHKREKINAATSLITNILLKANDPDKLDYTELDHFAHCLDSLSIGAYEVISLACVLANSNAGKYELGSFHFCFRDLSEKMQDTDDSLIMALTTELTSLNLLERSQMRIQVKDYSDYYYKLTPLGTKFVKHLIDNP